MNQTRNLTRHVKEIENLYADIINESNKITGFEREKDVDEHEIVGSGPDDVDGLDTNDKQKKKIKKTKESSNTVKIESKSINTSMTEKNIFDKLYSTIMENDEDFDMGQLDAGLDDGEMGLDDESESGEVTITLTQDQADVLRDVLSQIDGGEDIEDIEDLDGGEGDDIEDHNAPFPEAVDADHTSQGQHPGQDPTQLGITKKNIVAGTASKTTSGGASSDVTDKVGNDGHAPDSTASLTSTGSRSNVVSGKITGNNQGLLA